MSVKKKKYDWIWDYRSNHKYLVVTIDMMIYRDNSIFGITINWRFVVWPIIEEYWKVYESSSVTCKVQKWL